MHLGGSNLKVVGLLASGRRRRKLRSDLKVSQQVIAGEVTFVVKIPETGDYLRLPEFEWETLGLFDGSRTDKVVWDELHRRNGDSEMTVTELEDYADNTDPNVWEKTLTEKNLALLEKIRSERHERASDKSIFYMYFSAWDPDKFFNAVIPRLRWIWTWPFLSFTLAVFAVAVVVFVADFQRLLQDTLQFYNFREKTLAEFVDFWILLFVVGFIHESAHGLTCKNYGGEVHQMGFLLVYFSPAFYVDVSDMYLFDHDNKRFWTIFSGLYSTGFLGALGVIVWYFTIPGTFANDWAYKFVLMCSITTIVMNLNPLMKYDGYYALCQALKIDNLLEDSVPYLGQWARHYLSGGREPVERVSRRKHRVYLIYGTLHILYANFVILVILFFVKNVAVSTMGLWGWVAAGVLAWILLRPSVMALGRLLGVALKHSKEAVMRWQSSWQSKAVAATLLALVLLPPFASKVTTDFVLEPGARVEVRAQVGGTLSEVRVREGEEVEAGALLAVLRNPEVEARAVVVHHELDLAEQRLRQARANGDLAAALDAERNRQRLAAEWEEVRRKQSDLTLSSPISGVVTSPQVEQRVGEYLEEGALLAVVADRSHLRARVLVRDSELEEFAQGSPVSLKVRALPLETFSGQVQQIMPAAASDRPVAAPEPITRQGQELYNYVALTLDIPNPEGKLWEGMTGTAKIYGRRYPLAWRGVRATYRWARSQIWGLF